jgi:hypothetical protein
MYSLCRVWSSPAMPIVCVLARRKPATSSDFGTGRCRRMLSKT